MICLWRHVEFLRFLYLDAAHQISPIFTEPSYRSQSLTCAMVNRAKALRVLWVRFMSSGFFQLSAFEYAPAWYHNTHLQFAPAK